MKVDHSRFELRFQRLMIVRSESWGDAPGLNEDALSALNRKSSGNVISAISAAILNEDALSALNRKSSGNVISAISAAILNENGLPALNRKSVEELISAKGATITNSLGQRPRDWCKTKRPALEARFMEPLL